jgi:hypothetical protein
VRTLPQDLDDYRRSVDRFRWDVPEEFNFGRDVVDRLAADPNRPALLWRNASGSERRLSFADVARESNRIRSIFSRDSQSSSCSPVSRSGTSRWSAR